MSAVFDLVEDAVDAVVDFAGDVVDGISDALSWIDDEIIQPVVHTVEKTVEAALDDPIGTIAKVATAIYAPYLLPVTNAAVALANGASLEDAALTAAATYIAPEVGKFVGASTAPALGTTVAKVAAGAAASATGSVITGRGDPLTALLSGGISAATPIMTSEIPGFDQLPGEAQKLVNSAISAELTGRDPSQSAVNAALGIGIQMTADYLKDEYDLGTDDAVTRLAASMIKAPSSGAPSGGAQPVIDSATGMPKLDSSGQVIYSDTGATGTPVPDITLEEGRALADLSEDEYQQLLEAFYGGDLPSGETIALNEQTEYETRDTEAEAAPQSFEELGLQDLGLESEWMNEPMVDPFASEDISFGKAFAQARLGGQSTFSWGGNEYTTQIAEEAPTAEVFGAGAGRGVQGGPTAAELAAYNATQEPVFSGRGAQGGPTAEELMAYAGQGTPFEFKPSEGEPTSEEEMALADYFNMQKTPYPEALAFGKGLLGVAPDQTGYSVLQPDVEGIKSAGEVGFGINTALTGLPGLATLAKYGTKGIDALVSGGQYVDDAVARLLQPSASAPASAALRPTQTNAAYFGPANTGMTVFTPQSRQMGTMLVDMSSNVPAGSAADQTIGAALQMLNAGEANTAYKLLMSNPATRDSAIQYMQKMGYSATTPYFSPSGSSALTFLGQ